jgi:hypothetical protein
MPVITRNQRKNMSVADPLQLEQPVNMVTLQLEQPVKNFVKEDALLLTKHAVEFRRDIAQLLKDFDSSPDKATRMSILTHIYNIIDDKLEKLLDIPRWISFAATVYNKTTDFERQRLTCYKGLDTQLVSTFTERYQKVRLFLTVFFTNLRATKSTLVDITCEPYAEMFKNIDEARPRRNVPVIDYTGM